MIPTHRHEATPPILWLLHLRTQIQGNRIKSSLLCPIGIPDVQNPGIYYMVDLCHSVLGWFVMQKYKFGEKGERGVKTFLSSMRGWIISVLWSQTNMSWYMLCCGVKLAWTVLRCYNAVDHGGIWNVSFEYMRMPQLDILSYVSL